MHKPDFKAVYSKLLIGNKVRVLNGTHFSDGVLMDKYLADDNVYIDILLDNGIIIERKNFFFGSSQVVSVL